MRSPYDRNLLSDSLRPDIANSFPAYSECQHSSASSHEHKPCSLDRLSEAFGDGCDVYGGEGGNLCLEVAECLHCEVVVGCLGNGFLERDACEVRRIRNLLAAWKWTGSNPPPSSQRASICMVPYPFITYTTLLVTYNHTHHNGKARRDPFRRL